MKNFSEKELNEMILMYENKHSLENISKNFNCCSDVISRALKEAGITISKRGYSNVNRFSKEKEQTIIDLYLSGKSQKEIAIIFNTFNTSIRRVLLRNNIIPRTDSKILRYCKHNPFRKKDEYSDYFLGMLLTDGCITSKNSGRVPSVNLSLNSEDDYIIREFRDWASPKSKISYLYQKLNGSYMASVSFSNEEMNEWLFLRGRFKNKSRECKIYYPINWTILRGVFDGDGGWYIENKEGLKFSVCSASKVFIEQLNSFLHRNNINSYIRETVPSKYHKNSLYYVEVYNYLDVLKIGLKMYSNASIFLTRKYFKWLTFYESKRDNYALNSGNDWQSNPEQSLPTEVVINKLGRNVQRL